MTRKLKSALTAITLVLSVLASGATAALALDKKYLPQACTDASCRLSQQAQQDAARARAESNRVRIRDDRHDYRLKVGPNTSVGVGAGGVNIRHTHK